MRRIDAVHLEMPWFGARGLRRVLKHEFPGVGRRRFGTLMRTMRISAIAPQPGTSRRHRAHPRLWREIGKLWNDPFPFPSEKLR
jgi:putative transposase